MEVVSVYFFDIHEYVSAMPAISIALRLMEGWSFLCQLKVMLLEDISLKLKIQYVIGRNFAWIKNILCYWKTFRLNQRYSNGIHEQHESFMHVTKVNEWIDQLYFMGMDIGVSITNNHDRVLNWWKKTTLYCALIKAILRGAYERSQVLFFWYFDVFAFVTTRQIE